MTPPTIADIEALEIGQSLEYYRGHNFARAVNPNPRKDSKTKQAAKDAPALKTVRDYLHNGIGFVTRYNYDLQANEVVRDESLPVVFSLTQKRLTPHSRNKKGDVFNNSKSVYAYFVTRIAA